VSGEGDPTKTEPEQDRASADAALRALLAAHPEALVTAIGSEGRLAPVPASVPLDGHRILEGRSGLDIVVPEDRLVIIDAWTRARHEPVVTFDVHLQMAPEHNATVHIFDVRAQHGTHVVVVMSRDQALVLASAQASAQVPAGVARVRKDAAAMILHADAATTAMLGWSADELVGRRTVDFIHPEDVQRAIEAWVEMRAGAGSGRIQLRHRHAHGHYVWVEVTNENHLDDPERGCVVSELVDISEQMAHVEALREREQLLGRLAEALPIGICHVRADRAIAYSNELLVALLGTVDGIDDLIDSVTRADRPLVSLALDEALRGHPGQIEVGVLHGPEERRCELTFRAMRSDAGTVDGVIVCAADVTDRSRLRAELEHRASHDALSGCLNRAAIVAALERALRMSEEVAVVYVDVDHLKHVNDSLGHAAGDELLRVAAARLRGAARADDRIGRIGGDEFVVVCRRGAGPFEVDALIERFSEAITGDVLFAKQRIPLRSSVGVALSRPGELDAEAVLSRADAAMYDVKRRSRAQLVNLRSVQQEG
jgi:diguanylate cyclase (GGDEF)-like protein/PAS domain S-box-containing protein